MGNTSQTVTTRTRGQSPLSTGCTGWWAGLVEQADVAEALLEKDKHYSQGGTFPLCLSGEGIKWYYYDIVLWL